MGRHSIVGLGLVVLGCTEPEAALHGGTECLELGSPLMDKAKPAADPDPDRAIECSLGWGTDAPQLDSTWTVESPNAWEWIESIDRHPLGGVVVMGGESASTTRRLARYEVDGSLVWAIEAGIGTTMAVHASGDVFLAHGSGSVRRFDPDGDLIEAFASEVLFAGVVDMQRHADTILVMGYAVAGQPLELLTLDAQANLLDPRPCLHEPISHDFFGSAMFGWALLAATTDVALCGDGIYGFEDGLLLDQLELPCGYCVAARGIESDLVVVGTTNHNLWLGRYSPTGVEQWTREYDRARDQDQALGVAIAGDQIVVAGFTDIPTVSDNLTNDGHPFVIATDGEGTAIWRDQISANGSANAVVFGTEGEVYVAGIAQRSGVPSGQVRRIGWLRRYDPPG